MKNHEKLYAWYFVEKYVIALKTIETRFCMENDLLILQTMKGY